MKMPVLLCSLFLFAQQKRLPKIYPLLLTGVRHSKKPVGKKDLAL